MVYPTAIRYPTADVQILPALDHIFVEDWIQSTPELRRKNSFRERQADCMNMQADYYSQNVQSSLFHSNTDEITSRLLDDALTISKHEVQLGLRRLLDKVCCMWLLAHSEPCAA
jgi:hypothetical protein